MIFIKKIYQEEQGQVLYLSLVMLGLLTVFTLILANVIYITILQVKTQNTADLIAISVANKKARLLNEITELNGLIEYGALLGKSKRKTPYTSLDIVFYKAGLVVNNLIIAKIIKYNEEITSLIDSLARQNSLAEETTRLGVYPVDINYGLDILPEYINCYFLPPPPAEVPILLPIPLGTKFEPLATPWWIQTRVEYQLKHKLIGSQRLALTLPDIVTRARVEIYDSANLSLPWNHNWRTRLVTYDSKVDTYISEKM